MRLYFHSRQSVAGSLLDLYTIRGVSSLRSLSPCKCVEVFEWYGCHFYYALHLHCTVPRALTVLYCTCSDLQFIYIPLAIQWNLSIKEL